MSQRPCGSRSFEVQPVCVPAPGPSEAASATEHQAALDATLFRREREASELILELEAGVLRLRLRD